MFGFPLHQTSLASQISFILSLVLDWGQLSLVSSVLGPPSQTTEPVPPGAAPVSGGLGRGRRAAELRASCEEPSEGSTEFPVLGAGIDFTLRARTSGTGFPVSGARAGQLGFQPQTENPDPPNLKAWTCPWEQTPHCISGGGMRARGRPCLCCPFSPPGRTAPGVTSSPALSWAAEPSGKEGKAAGRGRCRGVRHQQEQRVCVFVFFFF